MTPLDPVPKPIDHVLRGAPEAPALIDRAGVMTYADVERQVAAVAGWLARLDLPTGERVATWLPKTRLACVMPLAAARAGLVHVPINPLLRRAQVAHILADSGAAIMVSQPTRIETLKTGDVPAGCRTIDEADVPATGEGHRPSAGGPDDLVAILYTSGSTGRPKGVMLSNANLWFGAISVAAYLGLRGDDRVLGLLPLSFDYGQNQLFSTWAAGGTVVPLDYLGAGDVVKAVERDAITTIAGVPPLWVQLLEANWPPATAARLRRLTNSGGALTRRLAGDLRNRFPEADVYAMYGLTESFRSTYLEPALLATNPDAMGRAIPFADVMVVRADGSRAAPGEPGELVHAGPLVAQGYWRDPERTAERFRPAPNFSAHRGRAVWSGDTVIEGEDGLFRFVGRDDEMIKSAGNRISPTEIEEAVLGGDEASEAVAVGVPDPRLGQAIAVALAGDAAAEPRLRARLKTMLPSFMQPAVYFWHAALPRNANGKLDRSAIRAQVTS